MNIYSTYHVSYIPAFDGQGIFKKTNEEINMFEAELENHTDPMQREMNDSEDADFEAPSTDVAIPGEDLITLLEAYEAIKDRMDGLQAERNALREEIQTHLAGNNISYTEVPVPSGRAYKVSLSSRIMETVTREGKSFIKVHATPELLESLIRINERETLAIREMTGVPRQSLFNRVQGPES